MATIRARSESRSPSVAASRDVAAVGEVILSCSDDSFPWVRDYVRWHRERIAFDVDHTCELAGSDDKILDVGSAPFLLIAALKARGLDVTGIDINPDRMSRLVDTLGLCVKRCDVEREQLPFESGVFDLVVFNEIFEHLRINPIFTLSEIHRVLRPSGKLLLSTPNLRSLGGIRNFLLRNQAFSCVSGVHSEYLKLDRLGHMGHVREYTTEEVRVFLIEVGFLPKTLIFRSCYKRRLWDLATRCVPALRPHFAYVSAKQAA